MHRTLLLVTSLSTAASLFLALLTCAAPLAALPPEQTQGQVTYRSGGVGEAEARAFAAAAPQYPLALEFAVKHTLRTTFVAKVHFTITDRQGQCILDVQSQGPFFLARLPVGYYTVTAVQQGEALSRAVHITQAKSTHVLFLWRVGR